MDVGTVLSVAQSLSGALRSEELKDLCCIWGYESELENLDRTVSIIKAALLDADSMKPQIELSNQAQLWVGELRNVVFDADDLLDEFVTLAEQNKLMDTEDGSVFKKVRRFFSYSNPLLVAIHMARGVKEIRSRLDAIASDYVHFGLKLDCQPIRLRRDETCSYVYAKNIIGRDHDKDKIVNRLLDFNVNSTVSLLSIVGVGGLGKTALAQLVYNDPRVGSNFTLRLWVCVADEGQKRLDVKTVLVKVLQSATGQKHEDLMGKNLECLQGELQMQLSGHRYLLVLDDVWNEDRHQWGKLMQFFMGSLLGSWIIMTTRSKMAAEVSGDGLVYELKGLSEEDSWHLFETTAFGLGCALQNPPELVEIGREIVKKCAHVPLAIPVVGSLLYGHGREKWKSFQEIGIGRIRSGEDGIEPILKLSYLHLETSLRICFSYCALFPKDCVLEKDTLISLWMAQGYIVPLEECQSIEDAGEEYFLILLKRCFFQDVEKDEYGEVVSCKMHDLMHDIAQQVAGKEIYTASFITSKLDTRIRHFCHFDGGKGAEISFTRTKIRTYVQVAKRVIPVDKLLVNWTCLRALDLSYLMIENLPEAIGKLLHLRYLDLSGNLWLEVLPKSIRELHNLQTLKLRGCHGLLELPENLSKLVKLRFLDLNDLNIKHLPSTMGKLMHLSHIDLSGNDWLNVLPESLTDLTDLRTLRLRCCDSLRELPKNMSKLVKLRVLDITGCWQLNDIPCGIGKLSCLQTLPLFVVSEKSSSSNAHFIDMLEDLKALTNLNGHLEIRFNISEDATYVKENGREGEYLKNMQHLKHIIINFHGGGESNIVDYEEPLLDDLQPHPNLKGLQLFGYCGKNMPGWARDYCLPTNLPNLVKVHIISCDGLQYLTSLGKLCHLKSLIVEQLGNLEYIENTRSSSNNDVGSSESDSGPFFPSLETLKLEDLPKLKGWWRTHEKFGRIGMYKYCLPSFPQLCDLRIWGCPCLTSIPLSPTIERLSLGKSNTKLRIMESESRNSNLRIVYTEDIRCLHSALPVESFQCLRQMEIREDNDVESLTEVWELFQRCSSSLCSLVIDRCPKLFNLNGGLLFLTSLVTLHLINLPRLNLSLSTSMEALTSLTSILIKDCEHLLSLPNYFQELTSLQLLEIDGCSASLKKSLNPTGQDWPKIKHIAYVIITNVHETDSSEESHEEFNKESDEDKDSEFSSESNSVHCL